MHAYEVRPHKDPRGVDLISDALPFGGLDWSISKPTPQSATQSIVVDHTML